MLTREHHRDYSSNEKNDCALVETELLATHEKATDV